MLLVCVLCGKQYPDAVTPPEGGCDGWLRNRLGDFVACGCRRYRAVPEADRPLTVEGRQ